MTTQHSRILIKIIAEGRQLSVCRYKKVSSFVATPPLSPSRRPVENGEGGRKRESRRSRSERSSESFTSNTCPATQTSYCLEETWRKIVELSIKNRLISHYRGVQFFSSLPNIPSTTHACQYHLHCHSI